MSIYGGPESPVAYIGIIDDSGRRLYSGNITWLREYIQNSIDAGAITITITLKDNDLEISDDGSGMNEKELIRQAFSIGRSFKGPKEIGELGVGIFAGSGTCDKIVVLTKKEGDIVLEATMDMAGFRNINKERPDTTFEEGMKKLLKIREPKDIVNFPESKHFTKMRFEGLNRDTLKLLGFDELAVFIENTVDLPINENFPHKKELEEFLRGSSLNIKVFLTVGDETKELRKFSPSVVKFVDTFWAKDIMSGGNVIGKIWAVYNKEGQSFYGNGIRVKRKGLTVGDPSYVESKFSAKYSERFYGEIIALEDSLEINTSRDWFISNAALNTFVKETRLLLNELYSVANFDSDVGIGIVNLIESNRRLEEQAEVAEKKGNIGTANDKRQKIEKNKEKIGSKLERAIDYRRRVQDGTIDVSDPTNKLKSELIERVLSNNDINEFLQEQPQSTAQKGRPRKNPFPEIVRTFMQNKIIDNELAGVIGNGDIKDTTNRAFTYLEIKLKELVGKKANEDVKWNDLLALFMKQYNPPDYDGFDPREHKEAFAQVMKGLHSFLRNPSSHNFMNNLNNTRNLFQVILIVDFLVNWIGQWQKISY